MVKVDVLLVNPWVYDFACYDFWLKPFGLLKIGGFLRSKGYSVFLYDFLSKVKRQRYGTGHFYKEPVPKDCRLLDVPRRYYRYGLQYEVAVRDLTNIYPSVILVASGMTYWYPGLFATIDLLKKVFKDVPIGVGGIYASLLGEHIVEHYPDVAILRDKGDTLRFVESFIDVPSGVLGSNYPVFDLYRDLDYVILETSEGCPFKCSYCASYSIKGEYRERNYMEVFEELLFWYENYGVKDFAFYDDALLYNFEKKLAPFLELVLSRGLKVRFHTPNGVHVRFITKDVALLLKRAGFKTLRLGVERIFRRIDDKKTYDEVVAAVRYLKEAGFTKEEVGCYLLVGLPEEDWDEVEREILLIDELGISCYLAEFSPVPGTLLFEAVKSYSRYNLDDPIFHNNSIFPMLKKPDWDRIERVKSLARTLRKVDYRVVEPS